MARYVGKRVVVTGAADGLGRALALGYAGEGAHVIVTDIAADGLNETIRLIEGAGGTAQAHIFDVTDEAAVQAFAARLGEEFDGIDLLYNNAGLAYGLVSDRSRLDEVTQADWMRFLAVNTVAPAVLAKALRPLLKMRRGNIINQSSMSSSEPMGIYGITKSALNGVTRLLAAIYGADGIRVNAIAPGLMVTPANIAGLGEAFLAQMIDKQMLHRQGTPDDIVKLALFLGSDEASFITCEVVFCDGGSPIRQWRY